MILLQSLYQLLIGPLELLFEVVYDVFYRATGDPGVAILPLSICVNVLLLPFYNRADELQRAERERERRMRFAASHIKETFRGDERFMILQAYYRICRYRPIHALKSVVPLALEIPFFIAAFHFLSNLHLLQNAAFLMISDLGKPDALLEVGGVSVNVLPIAMTLVNMVSSEVVLRGASARERFQLYGMSLIFLIILYGSPSGLVLYWLYNNVFALCKNMVNATQHKAEVVMAIACGFGIALAAIGAWLHFSDGLDFVPFAAAAATLQVPMIVHLAWKKRSVSAIDLKNQQVDPRFFFLGCVFLSVLLGVIIPSSAVLSSPAEFTLITDYTPALLNVVNAFLIAAGTFIVWFGLFYFLASERAKHAFEVAVWAVSLTALANFMLFGSSTGTITNQLKFESSPAFTTVDFILSAEVAFFLSAALVVLWQKRKSVVKAVCSVLLCAVSAMAIANVTSIVVSQQGVDEALTSVSSKEIPTFELSREGKNVVVLMLDRAISPYIPYLFAEKPQLAEQFAGFTWYPNTISYGPHTNIGTPGLFGGYEYTPEEMNARSGEQLADKHDEALKVMPALFSEAGFDVTVCDPPYAGYGWLPDLSIYDGMEGVDAYVTTNGTFNDYFKLSEEELAAIWRRNFFCYSLMKSSPTVLQLEVYQGGNYFNPNNEHGMTAYGTQDIINKSRATGMEMGFMNSFGALKAMSEMAQITDGEEGTFLMMSNCTTHDVMMLQEPDYEPLLEIDNTEYDRLSQGRFTVNGRTMHVDDANEMRYYQSNMAALLKVGEWLDYLRERDVYDNTRIIIVSDHGFYLPQFDDMIFGEAYWENAMYYNPLLLVKDFGASGGFARDDTFMTNADTPALAMEDLINDPVNPFTGRRIADVATQAKAAPEQHILFTKEWKTEVNNGNTFLPGTWYAVHDNIFDMDNWRKVGEY